MELRQLSRRIHLWDNRFTLLLVSKVPMKVYVAVLVICIACAAELNKTE